MPGPHPQGADLLGFLEQALRRANRPEPAPILDPEGIQYHAHWQRGVPLYHKTTVTVHAHPDLGVDSRPGAYECVGPGWQPNVLLTHVLFGEETKDFLDALSLAYRRLPLLAPTIIIRDLNAAPTDDDRTGPHTATDKAVRDAMHQLSLTDLLAGLAGTSPPLPPPRRHPRLPHRHVLWGPNHSTRPRGNLRGPPARRHGPLTPLHRPHHFQPTLTRGNPARRHPRTHTTVPSRERPRRLAQV